MSCLSCQKQAVPSLMTQVSSFGMALVSEAGAIFHGHEPVSAEEQHARLSICVTCPNYDTGRCLLCGCNMDVKAGFRTAKCADNPPRW